MKLQEVKDTVNKWLLLKDDLVVDIVLGTIQANRLIGDPVWTLIIAPPSSAKTEILRALKKVEDIHYISSMTAQTLISGKLKERSLLFKLNNKSLVIKDLGTILTLRSEVQNEILSQIREIFDGFYKKAFGEGKKPEVEWEGKVGLIAGVTPYIDKCFSIHQQLGDRFLQFRIANEDSINVGRRAIKFTGQELEMRDELSETFEKFLSQFEKNTKVSEINLNDSIEEKLLALTELCAMGRTGVSRDRYTRAVEYLPLPEGPARLIKQFRTLAAGIAIINGKTEIDGDIYGVIKRIGENTIPGPRNLVLKTLKRLGITYEDDQWLKTREISEAINIPSPTTKLLLEDMMMLELLKRRFLGGAYGEDLKENTPYQWQITDRTYKLMEKSEIYEFDGQYDNDLPF